MKIVLDTKRGSAYDDEVASHYHFPSRYLRQLEKALNDWVVFRRPRDGDEGIAYFAVARVVDILPDEESDGFYYAIIADYLQFSSPVPWKPGGGYAEQALREIRDVSKVGIYLRGRSVRRLEDADFDAIVDLGLRKVLDPGGANRWWPKGDSLAENATISRSREERLMNRAVRDASFRKVVCEAYEDRCAVTRLRIVNGGGRSEVQAAHIQPVKNDGPDVIQNGLALSATAHWLFDRHLITIDPAFRLIVAHDRIPSEFHHLLEPSLTRIHLPRDKRLYPSARFLKHHRDRFVSASL